MVPGKWGLGRATERDSVESLGWTTGMGEVEDGQEDHVAGLVEQIALTMLEEDDEETRQENIRGGSLPLPRAQSAARAFASNWDKRQVESVKALSGLPEPVQKRIESEAMELLYTELIRLKMEELATAQEQLSLYQKAFMDARQSSHLGFASTVGLSNMPASSTLVKQQRSLKSVYNKQLHIHSGGGDWSVSNSMQCQASGSSPGQRLGAPLMYPSARYLTRTTSLGGRESGGTGVFLPRCRTSARNLRTHDSRRKPEFQLPVSSGRPYTNLPDKAKENVADGPSLQYPSCSPLQEVTPDISLPTEWTY